MNASIRKTYFFHKCHFNVMEKLCDFFTLRPFITTLTYVIMSLLFPLSLSLSLFLSLSHSFSLSLSLSQYLIWIIGNPCMISLNYLSLSLSLSLCLSKSSPLIALNAYLWTFSSLFNLKLMNNFYFIVRLRTM